MGKRVQAHDAENTRKARETLRAAGIHLSIQLCARPDAGADAGCASRVGNPLCVWHVRYPLGCGECLARGSSDLQPHEQLLYSFCQDWQSEWCRPAGVALYSPETERLIEFRMEGTAAGQADGKKDRLDVIEKAFGQ